AAERVVLPLVQPFILPTTDRPYRPTRNVTLLRRRGWLLDDHLVDETVFLRLPCAHEVVAIRVLLDAVELLTGVLHQDFIQLCLETQDFLRVQLDVARLAPEPAARLVD